MKLSVKWLAGLAILVFSAWVPVRVNPSSTISDARLNILNMWMVLSRRVPSVRERLLGWSLPCTRRSSVC